MYPGTQNLVEHILPNITERRHGIARRTRTSIGHPLKKKSYVLMSLNTQIAKEIIKQTVILVHIGITISIGIGIVENNRNSFESRVQIV